MLSRVAESLFWLGRYTERADNYARFTDVNFNLSLDLPPGMKEQWEPLIAATGDWDDFTKRHKDFTRESAINFLAFDTENPNSIINSIKQARENARVVRENLSKEMWEVLNDLYHYINTAAKKKIWRKEDPSDFFRHVKESIQLLNGLTYDTAPRTEGYYFTRLGQFLERADKTSRILDVKYHVLLPSVEDVGSPLDFLHWTALLKSVSAFNAYRRNYGTIMPSNVVEYLVLDSKFPRSILFSLSNAEECLHEISDSRGRSGFSNRIEKLIGNLRSDLEFAEVSDVINFGLHEYMDNLQQKINTLSEAIFEQYFKVKPNYVLEEQSQ
ncbi:alpha-E domain-containing protein [Marinoscillum sp. MHG1-6]|uniref:alpha-E domain-containing protein n=1 Tax=Marinoscillum sp. MHG1-6 TaxID=2959627 RepID=UPI00215745A5|nr:alpha-E domain-containing protein [Marinoscillum sp. MHG1-6]